MLKATPSETDCYVRLCFRSFVSASALADAFERRERELRKQERLERAKLKFPALIDELQY